jgi:cytochrome b subunit of formate dehydrogenase
MSKERKFLRFTISDRAEHWVQMLSFTTLGLTGLIQKYAASSISIWLITLLGGIESVRVIHRIASMGLMFGTVYHLGTSGYKYYVQRNRISMLPGIKDITNAWGIFMNNLGLKKNRPQQGRYTFDEKFEYWAFVWGTAVMGLTGFMLWNPIATSKFLPGVAIPAAKAAHSGEALLAVLAIVIWHFYNVHIKHLNKSMFSGYLSEHEMIEEHPLELADIKAGIHEIPQDPQVVAKRKKIFIPVYSIIAAVLLVAIYMFVTIEETAIATVPPAENVKVFAPLTPTPLPTPMPTPTPAPVGNTWNEGVAALMIDKCGTCHAASVLGGLDVTSYENTLKGGNSGPGIIPGDSEGSKIVQRQLTGDHPGQFTAEELDNLIEWIAAGALE